MNLPELLRNGLVQNNNSDSYQYLAVTTFSDYIAQYLARMAVNGISFLISLLMSTIMVRSITWMLNLVTRLPVLHGMNKVAGALLSLIHIFWHEYAKIPRHTSQNSIAAGNLE